jgi:formyl-CoA transferase
MVLQTHDVEGRPLRVPGIVPKLAATPGRLRTPAPRLGQHNDSVLGQPGWPAAAANDEHA